MASKGSRVSEARPAVEIAERVKLIRQVIRLADEQIEKARGDLALARVGLAELEEERATRGIPPSNGGAQ